jgi:hypothetical protein
VVVLFFCFVKWFCCCSKVWCELEEVHALCTCYIAMTKRKVLFWFIFKMQNIKIGSCFYFVFGLNCYKMWIARSGGVFEGTQSKLKVRLFKFLLIFLGVVFIIAFIGHKVSKGNVRVHYIFKILL